MFRQVKSEYRIKNWTFRCTKTPKPCLPIGLRSVNISRTVQIQRSGLSDGSVEVHHLYLLQVEVCSATELSASSIVLIWSCQFRFWVMMVPRRQNDSSVLTGHPHRMMGACGARDRPEVLNHLDCLQSIKLQHL